MFETAENKDFELESQWTFYIDGNEGLSTGSDFQNNLKNIGTFNTVKTFWSYYNNLPDVSLLGIGLSYHLMKRDLQPIRENQQISNGGQLKLRFKNQFSSEIWLEILMLIIGEQLSKLLNENDDDFIGIRFGRRKGNDIIQIWNKNSASINHKKVVDKIKELFPNKIVDHDYKSFKELNEQFSNEYSRRMPNQNYYN